MSSSISSQPVAATVNQETPVAAPRRRRASVSSTASGGSTSSRSRRKIVVSPNRRLIILALRYVISQKEYAFVRRNVFLKSPRSISSNTPTRGEFNAVVKAATWDDFLPSSSRAGIRMFLVCNTLLNGFEYVGAQLRSRREKFTPPTLRSFFSHSNFLASLSLSTLIVLHRLLYRFFYQLRSNLQLPQAKDFRVKYPKASQVFLSPKAPPLAASLAGFALAFHPDTERRVTVAVYTFVKSLEFVYNRLEDKGWFQNRPWWFGSWLLFPLTSGQLLYSFVFDRDCFPSEYSSFITKYSQEYIQPRPEGHPLHLPWPSTYEIVDALPKISSFRFPGFSSPILFPNAKNFPLTLDSIAPIISPAHPSIKCLQCALLHPAEPSCLKAYIHYWASELPRIARFLAVIYSVAWLPRYKKFLANPVSATAKISSATAFTSLFVTGSIGSAWAACCLLQHLLPRGFLPKERFRLAGMMGGMFAFVDRKAGRANFLYSLRIGLVSMWKMLVNKGLVRGVRNGDVLLFVAALMAINCVYERDAAAVSGGAARRVLASLRGRGLRDYVVEKRDKEKEKRSEDEATPAALEREGERVPREEGK